MTDLSPCPGCDSTLGPFTASPDGRLQVICSTCGLRGPYATMVETVEQRWERLPRPAAPGAQAVPAAPQSAPLADDSPEQGDPFARLLLDQLRRVTEGRQNRNGFTYDTKIPGPVIDKMLEHLGKLAEEGA